MAFDLEKATIAGKPIVDNDQTEQENTNEEEVVEGQPAEEEPSEVTDEEETVEREVEDEGEARPEEEPVKTNEEKDIVTPQLSEYDSIIQEDEFIKNLLEYRKANGDVSPYLKAYSLDYDSMSDDEIIRHAFEADTGSQELSPKSKERLFKETILSKYAVNEEDYEDDESLNEEKAFREDLKKRDAKLTRENLKKEQEKYRQSIIPQKPNEEELKAQAQEIEKMSRQGLGEALDSGKIGVSVEGVDLNYEIPSTENMLKHSMELGDWINDTFLKEDKQPDWEKFKLVNTFAQDPSKFLAEVVKAAKAAGKAEFESTLRNEETPEKGTTPPPPKKASTPLVKQLLTGTKYDR